MTRGITLGNMGFRRHRRIVVATFACALISACSASFQPKRFPTTALLYKASMGEFQKKHWENAVTGFERLTLDLSARDSLLPLSYLYLARAHEHMGDYLLAGQSFSRIAESPVKRTRRHLHQASQPSTEGESSTTIRPTSASVQASR